MSLKAYVTNVDALATLRTVVKQPLAQEVDDGFPDAVVDWLARLRLLAGVPFAYLVPDERLLPLESIRFFYVNRNWTDAAVEGALSVGAVSTRDRALLHALHEQLREAVDEGERLVRLGDTGQPKRSGGAEVMTGFLLRSRAVSGWPGIHVNATRDGVAVTLARMERLAPAVLLVLFDGVPDRVEIEEPRRGIQFGVDLARPDQPAGSRWVNLRVPATGRPPATEPRQVRAPFRSGAPGVLHMVELRRRLAQATSVPLGPDVTPAETAIQLLQFPYRQAFGERAGSIAGVFNVTLKMDVVRASHRMALP